MIKNIYLDANFDLDNPEYLYLGSSKMIDFDLLKKANYNNPDFKMYLTSYYNEACANAFALKLKENNSDRECNIKVDANSIPILKADNVDDLKDNTTVYVYAFLYDDLFKDEKNHHFSTTEVIKPLSMTEIVYRDYKIYYRINSNHPKVKQKICKNKSS